MKKILALIMTIITVLSFAACACSKSDENATEPSTEGATEIATGTESDLTLGETLGEYFIQLAEAGMSVDDIAGEMIAHPSILFNSTAVAVEPGFLPGFDGDITLFTNAMTFAPMMSSIAFVGYVFETDDPEALINSLEENANLRWNICVEAEEMVIRQHGNKVFFVMCNKEA